MRKLILVIAAVALFASCKKEGNETGSVTVTLSYFYNNFQGYKPDVNAEIYLFRKSNKQYEVNFVDYYIGGLTVVGSEEKVYPDFSAKADVNGVATIKNVPYGEYLLVAASKGRSVYSKKEIRVTSTEYTDVKNFGYLREFSDAGEAW